MSNFESLSIVRMFSNHRNYRRRNFQAKPELNDNETLCFIANEASESYNFNRHLRKSLRNLHMQEAKATIVLKRNRNAFDLETGIDILWETTRTLRSVRKPVAWLLRASGYEASSSSTAKKKKLKRPRRRILGPQAEILPASRAN